MRVVQMTLEPDLVERVDRAAKRLGVSRSGFTRKALEDALDRLRRQALEARHRDGYRRKPVKAGEFDVWPREQTVPRARIGALVTTLTAERMREARASLLFALGFDRPA